MIDMKLAPTSSMRHVVYPQAQVRNKAEEIGALRSRIMEISEQIALLAVYQVVGVPDRERGYVGRIHNFPFVWKFAKARHIRVRREEELKRNRHLWLK